jgi:hypothetical protein
MEIQGKFISLIVNLRSSYESESKSELKQWLIRAEGFYVCYNLNPILTYHGKKHGLEYISGSQMLLTTRVCEIFLFFLVIMKVS